MNDLQNLVCPECGDGVFVSTLSPEGWVMCRDMGHWVGPIEECKRLTKRAADVCHSCGATYTPGANYCHKCGTRR